MAVALTLQLARSLRLEAQARELELERATALAERILRESAGSARAFATLPAEQRVGFGRDGVLVDDQIGWLDEVPAREDEDLVVTDRLDRAARAEFADRDAGAAEREFATLLAASLPTRQRIVVLAAAAWQAQRAGGVERCATLRDELDSLLAGVTTRELGHRLLANAVAAAARLPRTAPMPASLATLVGALPASIAAGLPEGVPGRATASAIAERRARLQAIDAALRARLATGTELRAAGDGRLLWVMVRDPAEAGPAVGEAAFVDARGFVAAARAAGHEGALPEWPWLVEPSFAAAGEGDAAFADVPGLRGVVAGEALALGDRPWLLPALTGALLLAFAGALWQHLRAMRREAVAVRTQAEFLTTVTHELKTPLASIRLLGEMLAEGRAKGREGDYYRMLAGEAGRLSMLIENVLDLGRLERGERAYDLRAVDVGEVVAETLRLFEPVAVQAGVRVVWDDAFGGPATARLDRGALVQALVSVLDNARKYGKAPLELATKRRDGDLQIAIADHGPGVPADERERIFARFVRGRDHAHGGQPGVGIGLYLARTIARRLGGDLVCCARADGAAGACFTFTFPIAAETAS